MNIKINRWQSLNPAIKSLLHFTQFLSAKIDIPFYHQSKKSLNTLQFNKRQIAVFIRNKQFSP